MSYELDSNTKRAIINAKISKINQHIYNYDIELELAQAEEDGPDKEEKVDMFTRYRTEAFAKIDILNSHLALLSE